MPVLGKELADRDLPLLLGHRFGGGSPLGLRGRFSGAHDPDRYRRYWTYVKFAGPSQVPLLARAILRYEARPEQTAPLSPSTYLAARRPRNLLQSLMRSPLRLPCH